MSAKCMAIPSPSPHCCCWAVVGGIKQEVYLYNFYIWRINPVCQLNGSFHLWHQFARLLAFLQGRNSKRHLASLIFNKGINIFSKVRTMSNNHFFFFCNLVGTGSLLNKMYHRCLKLINLKGMGCYDLPTED